jgi:hypothetical protein
MSDGLRQIIPVPQPEADETFAAHQATANFYREVQSRQEFERYCHWYRMTARMHHQELQQMQGELNILSWFRGGRHK